MYLKYQIMNIENSQPDGHVGGLKTSTHSYSTTTSVVVSLLLCSFPILKVYHFRTPSLRAG